jgi:molybdopterin molybdotransferase
MPEFLQLLDPPEALKLFIETLPDQEIEAQPVTSSAALGRVLANPILAPHPLPNFPRSTVDGYAVMAADTFGASEGLPAYLTVIGEVPMGSAPNFQLTPSNCALIHTGGMLPDGANAVVMVEHTQSAREGEVEILRAAAVGENVLKVGEDVEKGQVVIPSGKRLRPAEIGGLMALGITQVEVARKPKVGIISSGDEVVSPDADLKPGQVRDVNTFTLGSLVEEAGGESAPYGIAGDEAEELLSLASEALTDCDVLVITAGSSASARDLTSEIINRLGKPGVLVHGINVRPGKPTILAVCDGKPVIGLPGNPVSALVIAGIFVVPVVHRLLGLAEESFRPSVPARLSLNLSSQAGREDWVAVRLIKDIDGFLAEPVFGKSNLIFTLSRCDGLIRIGADATGLNAGSQVEVQLL